MADSSSSPEAAGGASSTRRPEPPSARSRCSRGDRVGLHAHPRPRIALQHDGRGDAEPGGHLDDPVAVVQADALECARDHHRAARPGSTRPAVTRRARGQGAAVCCSIVVVIGLLAVPDQRVSHQERAGESNRTGNSVDRAAASEPANTPPAGPASGHAATTCPVAAATPGAAALRPRGDARCQAPPPAAQRRRAAHAGTAALDAAPGDRGQAARVDRGRPHGQRAPARRGARSRCSRSTAPAPAPGRRLDALRPRPRSPAPQATTASPRSLTAATGAWPMPDVRGRCPTARALPARGHQHRRATRQAHAPGDHRHAARESATRGPGGRLAGELGRRLEGARRPFARRAPGRPRPTPRARRSRGPPRAPAAPGRAPSGAAARTAHDPPRAGRAATRTR